MAPSMREIFPFLSFLRTQIPARILHYGSTHSQKLPVESESRAIKSIMPRRALLLEKWLDALCFIEVSISLSMVLRRFCYGCL